MNLLRSYTKRSLCMFMALLTVSLTTAPVAMAGSKESNPGALAKAAVEKRNDFRVVDTERNAFLTKLSTNRAFAKRFDAAVVKKDKEEVVKLLKEGGFKRSDVAVEEFGDDLWIRITIRWDHIVIIITINW
jgi:hypothetical protein